MLPFDSFVGFLNWLVGPGLPIVVGGTLSMLAWNIPQWRSCPRLSSRLPRLLWLSSIPIWDRLS